MNNVSNLLVKADCFCDYIPLVSSVTNLVDIFQKCVVIPFLNKATIDSNPYYTHINKKSFNRCLLLVIPIFGSILIGIYDFSNRKDKIIYKRLSDISSSSVKKPLGINKGSLQLGEKDAGKEIRISIGQRFSVELWHSSSTGHEPWIVSQAPSFIDSSDKYVNYQNHAPGLCGGGDGYGFVFESKAPGKGSITMKLPCSFDESRSVEKTFMMISE